MASINQRGGKLFFDFRWQGKRYREYTDLPDTPGNHKKAQAVLKHLENDLRKGTFTLEDYFPNSPRLEAGAPKQIATPAPTVAPPVQPLPPTPATVATPLFSHFSEDWFDEMRPQWRRSYEKNLRLTLDAHLLPRFGAQSLGEITKSGILTFRAALVEPTVWTSQGFVDTTMLKFEPSGGVYDKQAIYPGISGRGHQTNH
jgi:integrase